MSRNLLKLLFSLSLILTACNNNQENLQMDPHIAHEVLVEDMKNSNTLEQEDIIITKIYVEEKTDSLVIGLLELNSETEKKLKKILLEEILHQEVNLKLIEAGRAKAQ
jgi:uncharacterized protein YcfL